MVKVSETDSGVTISVRVQPNAKRESIVGAYGNQLKVAVTAPPEDGKANKAVIRLIAKEFHVKASCVKLISGHTSRDKKIHVEGISLSTLIHNYG